MKPSRIVLILVALLAGGLAAWLATRGGGAPTHVEQAAVRPAPAPTVAVLVATRDVNVGDTIHSGDVAWRDWPKDGVSPDYITKARMPDAPAKLDGAIVRLPILSDDPVRDDKLAQTDQGFLSALLPKGMRAVSVQVSPETGSGGFILPGDHVDVISTHAGPGGTQITEPVLQNVTVLAIGPNLGRAAAEKSGADTSSKPFSQPTIATLALDPGRARVLVNAEQTAKLSLLLRSVSDFAQTNTGDGHPEAIQSVKVIRFGRASSVETGGSAVIPPRVDTAAYTPPVPLEAGAPEQAVQPALTGASPPRPVLK